MEFTGRKSEIVGCHLPARCHEIPSHFSAFVSWAPRSQHLLSRVPRGMRIRSLAAQSDRTEGQ